MAQRLETALATLGEVSVGRILTAYPTAIDLVRTIRAEAPDVLFLSFEWVETAKLVLKCLAVEGAGVETIAVFRDSSSDALREAMRAGVREFVIYPFERQGLADSIHQIQAHLEQHPAIYEATSRIFSFLPSKAGVGTSTLALNVSAALSRLPETHVLLSDFDLTSGMLRFMLKLSNEYSIIDAVEHSHELDERFWATLVTSKDALGRPPRRQNQPEYPRRRFPMCGA